MTTPNRSGRPRRLSIVVYVRPTMMLEPRDEKLATLQRLQRDGDVSGITVRCLPEKINLDGPQNEEMVEFYYQLDQWATNQGVSLNPAFTISTTTSELWDVSRRILRTPMMILLVYSGTDLVGVFPHSTDSGHHSVSEALARIECDRLDGLIPESASITPESKRRCPECGAELVNIQAVLCCYSCNWDELSGENETPLQTDSAISL